MLTQLQVETGNVQMDQAGAHRMDVGYYTARSGVSPATMASMIHVDR